MKISRWVLSGGLVLALLAAIAGGADAQRVWPNDVSGRPAPPCTVYDPVANTVSFCSSTNPIPVSGGTGAGLGTTTGTSTTGFGKQWFPATITGTVATGQQMKAFFDSNLGTDTNTVVFFRRSTTCGNCLQVAVSTDGGVTATFSSTTLILANSVTAAFRVPSSGSSPPTYLVSAENGATTVNAASTSIFSGWTAITGTTANQTITDWGSNATGSTVLAVLETGEVCRSTNRGFAYTGCVAAGGGSGILQYAGGTTWLLFEGAAGNVRRSTDDGVSFSLVTSFGSTAQALRCLSPTYTTCIAKSGDGNVRLSTDGGATWPTIPLSGLGAGAFSACEAQANSPAGSGVFSILSATPPVGFATIGQNAFSSFNAGVSWFPGQTNGSPWDGTGAPSLNSIDCRNGKGAATYSTTGGGVNVFAVYNPLTSPGGVLQSSAGGYSVAALIQSGVIMQVAPTTSAANTAAAVTLTNTAGSRICIREVLVFSSAAGTPTLTITDGGTTVWNAGTLATGTAATRFAGSPLLCSQSGNTLVVNVGAAGAAVTTTTSVIADRYPN